MVFFPLAILAVSIFFLVYSSEKIIHSAVKLSELTGFNKFAIGIIFIAIGTSLPELTISVFSIIDKTTQLSVGVLFGSSIADMTIVFGILCFSSFIMKKEDKEVIASILLSGLIVIFALIMGVIDLTFGVFALIIFFFFLRKVIGVHYVVKTGEKHWIKTPETIKQIALLIVFILVLVISAKFVISSAIDIANYYSISSIIIGAILVGLGTVLPEMTVSIMAVRKGQLSLGIGNIAGSVITNTAMILGIIAFTNVVVIDSITRIIMMSFLAVSAILLLMTFHKKFNKLEGIALMAIYVVFVCIIIGAGIFLGL